MKKHSSNPIMKNIYTADPAPMVVGDTLYLYTTHDEDGSIDVIHKCDGVDEV